MSFERFCELVAKDTTLNYMEVQSVLNLAADMAREVVANGDIMDFGRLRTLSPSFKSKVVPVGSEFNANVHIIEPRVNLRSNATYFRLRPDEVSYERMEAKPKARKKDKKPEGGGGSTSNPGGQWSPGYIDVKPTGYLAVKPKRT